MGGDIEINIMFIQIFRRKMENFRGNAESPILCVHILNDSLKKFIKRIRITVFAVISIGKFRYGLKYFFQNP